eukprot:4971790-Amphidinium_carterae.2
MRRRYQKSVQMRVPSPSVFPTCVQHRHSQEAEVVAMKAKHVLNSRHEVWESDSKGQPVLAMESNAPD